MSGDSEQYIKKVYDTIKKQRSYYGEYRKAIFHIHTPASSDYTLLSEWKENEYKKKTDHELIHICYERKIVPKSSALEHVEMTEDKRKCFSSKNEWLSYIMLAGTLCIYNYEIVVVTDHNTLDGIEKLRTAVEEYYRVLCKGDPAKHYPNIIPGIEITCADKLHVVVIINDNIIHEVRNWMDEHIMSAADGTYCTSLEVIKHFKSIGCFAYIAHVNTANIFNDEKAFTGAYKKKLQEAGCLDYLGISRHDQIDNIKRRLQNNNIQSAYYIIDNDSHSIDLLSDNYFWIKTGKTGRNIFDSVIEALENYYVSVSLEAITKPQKYIEGMLIESSEKGFLKGKGKDPFEVKFSSALNCFIGGRGTGKSTLLQLIDFALGQRVSDERQLEFLCNHGNIWILYHFDRDEYLIKMDVPIKENDWENILSYYSESRRGQYYFNSEEIREYALKKYLTIYRKNKNLFSAIRDKRHFINTLFDTHYSVSEMMDIASTSERMSNFILDLMFKDKEIATVKLLKARSKKSLINWLNNFEQELNQRKKRVHEVIDPFNEREKDRLKIEYSQDGIPEKPAFEELMMIRRNDGNSDFYSFPIKNKNVVEYVYYIYNNTSLFEFFLIASDCNHDRRYEFPITDFLNDNASLGDQETKELVDLIFNELVNDITLTDVVTIINNAVKNIERFQLNFNINSKSTTNSKALFKRINELSQGQKVVAMLDFIMGYGTYIGDFRPLIIDQPEDNLDNQYIYKNLVQQLRSIKKERQVIIATHNATIVTNAMTDLVCVMESNGEHGWIEQIGYPSEERIKKSIVNYLEGGVESFNHKIRIYDSVVKKG